MIKMRLVLMPWAVSVLRLYPRCKDCAAFFDFGHPRKSLGAMRVGKSSHENAYFRKTPGASQPLERQELQTPPFCASRLGAEAAVDGELVVIEAAPRRFREKFS
jgi:hypothetical protein